MVAEDGRVAGSDLGFKPAPGGIGDEVVPGEVACGDGGFVVGGCWIESEELLGVVAEVGLGGCGEAGGGGFGFRHDDLSSRLVGVPTGQERDLGLFAGGIDAGDGVGEEVAVDAGPEARRWWRCLRCGGLEDVVGGELAEVGQS